MESGGGRAGGGRQTFSFMYLVFFVGFGGTGKVSLKTPSGAPITWGGESFHICLQLLV